MKLLREVGAAVLLLAASAPVFADEGMWVLKELNKQNLARMAELGFTPTYEQLYSETDPCVANAVVIFGGGCTGITVSGEGLIFTNHHCGYGSIQQLSSVEHDYLKDGFISQSKEEELPVPGLSVRYLRETVDVSDRVNSQIASIEDEYQRLAAADSIGQAICDSVGTNEFLSADVIPFYNNNKYYLVVYDVFRDGPFTWRARFNMAKNWNRFEKSYLGVDTDGMVIGKPMSGIYLYKDGGLIQSQEDVPYVYDEEGKKHVLSPEGDEEHFYTLGMRKPVDLDGDGQITEEDIYYVGSALPTLYGGFASEFTWKNFDLNLLIMYELGRNMVNAQHWHTLSSPGYGSSPLLAHVSLDEFWQAPGDETKYPAVGIYPNNTIQYMGEFDSDLEKVSYAKLKQLTIGYNVPKEYTKKLHLDNVRVFVTGENIFMLSNYSGLDPEVVNLHTGIDLGTQYPLARKWTIGLTVNF